MRKGRSWYRPWLRLFRKKFWKHVPRNNDYGDRAINSEKAHTTGASSIGREENVRRRRNKRLLRKEGATIRIARHAPIASGTQANGTYFGTIRDATSLELLREETLEKHSKRTVLLFGRVRP